MSLRIGIDFGGVCSVDSDNYEDDTKGHKESINVPGCVEALKELKRQGHQLVLVSFCGRKRAESNRRSDSIGYFHEAYFVKKRPYKSQVCHDRGLDILIDDRADILAVLQKDKRKTKTVKFGTHPSDGKVNFRPDHKVESWKEVLTLVSRLQAQHLPIVREVPAELIY